MSDQLGILLGLLVMLLALLSGMPVFAGIGIGGAFGAILFVGFKGLLNLGDLIFGSIWHVSFLAAPGFIVMGSLFFEHEFGRDLFETVDKWLRGLRGGLIIATIWMSALFGFICGSNMAGIATIGKIAIPEVESRGYNRRLSLGAFSIAGTLSVLIPPSLWMILYAVWAEVSLEDLFFAGIIPGIVLSLLLSAYVFLRVTFNKRLCPSLKQPVSWSQKLSSLKGIVPVVVTFGVVLGGIYYGIWSVVEASAAGAVLSILLCFVYRRFSWHKFVKSIAGTVRVVVMVYMISISATLLNYFVFVSHLDKYLLKIVSGFNLPGWAIIILILLLITIMGCFFDMLALMIISISLFLPITVKLGFDPVWFGIILIVGCELALVTPPVGVNLFIIKDLAPEGTTAADVALGAIPLVVVVWILFALLTIFPKLVLWLPSLVKAG
jgi:C4-dicarboxylate transporter DctM subunit